MMIQTRIALYALAVATLMTLIAPATGRAQDATPQGTPTLTDSRWQPWLGCWTPVERAPRDRDIQVCIVPTATGGGARMMTFAGDQRILDDTILADGSTQTLNEVGCRGSSRSRWAKNAARLFRTTELACDGKAPQRTAGISTLEESGRWLDVQVVVVGSGDQVRARHYVRSSETPPAEIADHVRRFPDGATRAKAMVTADDVIEANAIVSHRAVEVWLSESNAQVPVNRRTLLALHGANLPAPLIDLMVARAYPKKFEVRRSGSGGSGGSFGSFFDDVAWASPFDLLFDPYAFYYSPFGSYRQFVDPALYTIGGFITVPAESNGVAPQSGSARVVNGSGYTRVEPRQPAVVAGRTSGDSSESGGSSSSSGVSSPGSDGGSASPAGYSSGGGGGGGAQIAVPR
jgi:hypothetical protein